jgi:DNA-binding CsgD family transcriptional regulator
MTTEHLTHQPHPDVEQRAAAAHTAASGGPVRRPPSRADAEPARSRQTADSLAAAEWDLLELVADGEGIEKIARRLGVTTNAVELQIGEIRRRLGVRRCLELVHPSDDHHATAPDPEPSDAPSPTTHPLGDTSGRCRALAVGTRRRLHLAALRAAPAASGLVALAWAVAWPVFYNAPPAGRPVAGRAVPSAQDARTGQSAQTDSSRRPGEPWRAFLG